MKMINHDRRLLLVIMDNGRRFATKTKFVRRKTDEIFYPECSVCGTLLTINVEECHEKQMRDGFLSWQSFELMHPMNGCDTREELSRMVYKGSPHSVVRHWRKYLVRRAFGWRFVR